MRKLFKIFSTFSKIPPGKVNITMTSHPTNPNFAKVNTNGQVLRPKLWQEIKAYEEMTPALIENTISSGSLSYLNQINIWFDFDRHQDDRVGIIIYMYLINIEAIFRWYKKTTEGNQYDKVISEVRQLINFLQVKFNNQQTIALGNLQNFRNTLSNISTQIKSLNLTPKGIINPLGFNAHYRISSQDLDTKEHQQKILNRLKELKLIQDQFGRLPVSQIIIADCQSIQDIKTLRILCSQSGIKQKVSIVPLIETELGDRFLRNIIAQDIDKVMLAGSDTIQRDTYISALLMKLKLQLQILEDKNKRDIIFFEGTGSTVNRNGNMFRSRMGTILQGIQYQRTIQGKQRQEFMTDREYHIKTLMDLSQGRRSSVQDAETAIFILSRIYKQVSMFQIVEQKEPYFSQKYNKKKVYELLINNSHVGSRCVKPKQNLFTIKSQRAIPQSYLNIITGFHPQLLYWDYLTEKTKNLIKDNLDNKIIQDMLNHYTAISSVSCATAAQNYLRCKETIEKFKKGRQSLRAFFQELKILEIRQSTREGLLLLKQKQEVIKQAFNLQDFQTQQVFKSYKVFDEKRVKGAQCFKDQITRNKLFKRTGAGFSTLIKTGGQINKR